MLIEFLIWLRRFDLGEYFNVRLKYDIKKCFNNTKGKYELAIIDDKFPSAKPLGFRNNEINFLLDNIPNAVSYSIFPIRINLKSGWNNRFGRRYKEFKKCLKKYLKYYPKTKRKIEYLPYELKNKLVYSYFLNLTYTLLPFLEKNKLPFIFVLFPGGGFGINNEKSDFMLREICNSNFFQKVVITESITKRYLLENNFCSEDKIIEIYGGYPPFTKEEVFSRKKLYYPQDKKTIDICFCAFKYSPQGYDKGYDLYIETAKRLIPKYSNLRFHVIGPFDEHDIDVSSIKDNVLFHGIMTPNEIKEVYLGIDIFLTPNRPSALYKGNFDGFPLHGTSIFWGCTILNTDEYKTNTKFKDGEDLIIIKPEINNICENVEYLINNMGKTYEIGRNGQMRYFDIVDSRKRGNAICKLINNTLEELNK